MIVGLKFVELFLGYGFSENKTFSAQKVRSFLKQSIKIRGGGKAKRK